MLPDSSRENQPLSARAAYIAASVLLLSVPASATPSVHAGPVAARLGL